MKLDPSNSAYVIDSREVIARLEELESERGEFEIDPDENPAPDGPARHRDTQPH